MGKARIKEWMMENAYLMTLGCVIAMVAGCALYTQGIRHAQQTDVQAAAGAPEIVQTQEAAPRVTPLPTIAPLEIRPVMMTPRGGAWPVEGRVLRAYDAQESVYWQQLAVWQTHTGLDVAGEAGESVKACMDGMVESAAYDAMWGWRVSIAHEGDRISRYAGLAHCGVQPGESVRRGQVIGTLLEKIPCEAEMDTHLHLEMIREGKHQDPEATLEER